MKVSAFFENILTGARAKKISGEDALRRMQAAGLDTVYVGRDSIWEFGEDLLELLKSIGLPVEGLHGWFDFAGNPDGEEWKAFIDTAARWGAKHVLFVPGLNGTEERKCNMVSVLRKAVAYGREMGITVTMENLDQLTAPYNSAEGLNWFFSRVEGLQCCFDTGNFVIHQENALQLLEEFLPNLCTVHIKDRSKERLHMGDSACACADGSFVYPAPVGDGYIQILNILGRLKEIGYNGALIAELYGYDPAFMLEGILKSVSWLSTHK